MVSSIKSSQVRSAVSTQQKTPAKESKSATQASQTAAAGWGGGAAKTTSLKITNATIGDGPAVTPGKLQLPKGYKSEIKELKEKLTDKVGGKPASIEQDDVKVTLTRPDGKKIDFGNGAEGMKQLASDWKAEVAAQKKDPSEWSQLEWYSSHSMSGAGTVGKLFSVSEAYSSYTGGAHPNHGTGLGTFDASTGKQVKLDQLLSQQQMNNLVKDITARLPKLEGADGLEGSSFGLGGDLRDTINSNFALTTDKSGKVQIQIAWESGIHALSGQMAHFTVDAPNDPAFRKAAGLE